MESWLFAIFLGGLCGFLGGLCCYLVFHWGHLRFQLALEYRLNDLEGRVNRETKIRASEASKKSRNADAELLEQIKDQPVKQPFNLDTWRQKAFSRNG